MRREYKVGIIYRDKLVETVMVHAKNEDDASDRCFEYADSKLSAIQDFDPEQVELYHLNNPRHQVLFGNIDISNSPITGITKPLTNEEKIDLILKDLENWMHSGGDQCDCSMAYAFNNGYRLHAASLWLGAGVMSQEMEDLVQGVEIDRSEEEQEVSLLLKEANIYVCPDCDHHGFYEDDIGTETQCLSCLKTAYLKTKEEN